MDDSITEKYQAPLIFMRGLIFCFAYIICLHKLYKQLELGY